MANKEKMDHLLLDIRELEKMIAGMRDAEIYPISFFSQTFSLSHKIITELHLLEVEQLQMFRRQLEEHERLMETIPSAKAALQPEPVLQEETKNELMIEEEAFVESVIVEEVIEEPVSDKDEIAAKLALTTKQTLFLSEILEKKNLSDFRNAFNLNDRFRFRRELFGGDEGKMNKAVADLNEIHTYEDSISYLNQELKWNVDDEAVTDFIKLLEKRFL